MGNKLQLQIAKYGYLVLSTLFCALGILLLARPHFPVPLLCRIVGALLVLFGIVKIIGYLSQDLYRLAFQFDLALGLLLMALGTILLFRTEVVAHRICIVAGICVLADAFLKIQTAIDAKVFGIRLWWLILGGAIVAGITGFLLVFRPYESTGAVMTLSGVSLLSEGVLNFITICTALYRPRPDGGIKK